MTETIRKVNENWQARQGPPFALMRMQTNPSRIGCHYLCRVITSQIELGVEATFWKDKSATGSDSPNVVKFPMMG